MTVDKKKFENNKSSLTPLFERHSLREVEYQNPFYEDSESEATTADDIEFDTVDDNDMLDRRINDRIDSNKHCSLFGKLKQETKRIERLQSNISAIKRQSSLLAQGSLDSDYDEQRQEISTTNIPLSAKPNTPNYYTPQPSTNTYLTPPQSADKYRQSDSVDYNDNNGKSKIDNNSLLNGLSNARLRSAEIIRTPGGSRTCNRFWKEIHGLNAKKDTISPKVTSRVEKLSPKRVTKRLWDDNDDTFWTTECSMTKNSSSFNQKLMRMKRLENEQERVDKSIKRISLFDELQRLTNELAAAGAEIEQLCATTLQLQGQLSKENSPSSQHGTSSTTNTQYSIDFPDLTSVSPPWRNPDQVRRIKENLMQEQQQRRQQRQEAAARPLQPPSENQGFQYLYLPTKARVPIGQLRSRLRKLDINNNRILDIHYPDRNVVALLVHNDYANELRSQLKRFKITLKDNFDPCDPKILRDPKYFDATEEERANLAFMHHCNCMERALKFTRAPVKFAVARYFYTKGWISKQTLDETLSSRRTSQMEADPLFFEDERMSTTDDCQLSQSHTMESHMEDGSPL
ncbi:hypothetical protein G6F46_004968 [Rhizopus delemar]|nr:hypothetical protein G6F55_010840 [Rhizopus delemar]KAG1535550.1 hypothetical protein G6F51_011475 [Rhizopus arrhizus]KAG1500775.1 hypothetical protein G6F53_011228 [Rhizopus delemar]KAG1505032.1 hypothetical protein G6F54_000604 [Rhizopus delemar]KAG1521015.1 hypothetical protein G6F52_007123 [Rhizopus delemar]